MWGCTAYSYPSNEKDPTATLTSNEEWVGWKNPAYLPLTFDGEETYACPRQDLLQRPYDYKRVFTYYAMYQKGHLPQVGAISDQSNTAIELFKLIDDANLECDQVENDKRQRIAFQAANRGR